MILKRFLFVNIEFTKELYIFSVGFGRIGMCVKVYLLLLLTYLPHYCYWRIYRTFSHIFNKFFRYLFTRRTVFSIVLSSINCRWLKVIFSAIVQIFYDDSFNWIFVVGIIISVNIETKYFIIWIIILTLII